MKRRSGREMSCDASHQSQGNDLSRLKATEFRAVTRNVTASVSG